MLDTVSWLGVFFLLLSSGASLAFPWLLGKIVTVAGNGPVQSDGVEYTITQIAGAIFIILLVQAIFSYFRIVIFVNVTEKFLAEGQLTKSKRENIIGKFRRAYYAQMDE